MADVFALSVDNDGLNYLLIAIDVFSRYAWVRPLKDILHSSIIDALKDNFKTVRIHEELQTDKGSELKN